MLDFPTMLMAAAKKKTQKTAVTPRQNSEGKQL